ncbi:MAG: diaminopimelate epimerase [Armatimonadota bacterium]|nr:diaminopimelate epimerase [Armatimonadota bacterium]
MRFTKMHGLGNDFVIIDCIAQRLDETELERKSAALCDRRFGIGGDGLILIMPSSTADFRMRVINSDGSEAEMCGNGIRCLAKYVFDRNITAAGEITVETLAGIKTLVISSNNGKAESVRVDMGAPEFRRSLIPMFGEDALIVKEEALAAGGRELRVTCVSMGNPHCVTFVDDVAAYPVETIGPLVERHEAFPKRTNAEFIQVIGNGEIKMRVWERGAGETMACGTGACASAVASALNGKTSRQVLVHLAGGDLKIDWAEDGRVFMTGGAAEVYEGELDIVAFG